MNDKIRISGIIQEDTANGPGIRTTIFTQGCEIHCPGCQNSQTWDINGGTEYTYEMIKKLSMDTFPFNKSDMKLIDKQVEKYLMDSYHLKFIQKDELILKKFFNNK